MKMYEVIRSFLSASGTLPVLALALLLGGCSNSINLRTEAEVPQPLVPQIPLRVGIHFDKEFRNYVYQEDTEDRPDWHVDNRDSRLALFQQVLTSMFREVRQIDANQAPDNNIDAIISPEVEEMQLALPRETYSDLYEAWIKYNIRLYSTSGKLIAEWPVTGYGKAVKGFLGSRDKSLNKAIGMALRDIGAKLALGFPQASPVKQWLASRTSCEAAATTLSC